MSPQLDGDDVLGTATTPRRPRGGRRNEAPTTSESQSGAVIPTVAEAALWRPRVEDTHEFDTADQRMMSELTSAGRSGLRRAMLKQKQDVRLEQLEKRATRTAALNVLLTQQRQTVVAKAPSGGAGTLGKHMGGGGRALRPKATAPALPLSTDLWHSALMTAELGYNNKDLNLPGGSLRFETHNPQLINNDRLHYQRPIVEARVEKYLLLEPHLLAQRIGVLACRSDDSLWVIDGQHHTEAAVRIGIDLMGYWVFDSDGWVEERRVFQAFQAWKRGMGRVPDEPVG